MAELIPPKESVQRNRVHTTMNVLIPPLASVGCTSKFLFFVTHHPLPPGGSELNEDDALTAGVVRIGNNQSLIPSANSAVMAIFH
jgi:hypothetical protein